MASFARRVRTFQEVFPSSNASFAQPTEVGETVDLTHPFLAAGARLAESRVETVSGALGLTFVNFALVPEDRFWYVPFWSIKHNDAANRVVIWDLESRNLGNVINITTTRQQTESAIPGNRPQGLVRPIMIPPGYRAVAAVEAIAAGSSVTSNLMRVEYPLAENPPPY